MDHESGWKVAQWVWARREEIVNQLARIYRWFRGNEGARADPKPGILIIGAGGVGRTTLGGFLSGDFDFLTNPPGEYEESLSIEKVILSGEEHNQPSAAVVIPPGQEHRRDPTWSDLADLANGKFRGVILISAYGYHSLGISFKQHRLYSDNRGNRKFLTAFLEERRNDELAVLQRLVPHLKSNSNKLWFLSMISKQDLWWSKRPEVENHYEQGSYGTEIQQVRAHLGHNMFRHEFTYGSLVIANFVTGSNELLQKNTAGYAHHEYVQSLRRLFETMDALREWEMD